MGEAFKAPATALPLPTAESFRITDPERIPSRRYHDETFFELEKALFWPRVWQMACRLEEIPEVGDWVEYKILDKSVILVRGKSGVKAFHNTCRHRGVQLASGHGSCEVQGFICPFHGWRWNIEGENTFVYGRQMFNPALLEPEQIDLAPCRVEFWGGCAFINFDDEAPPLLDCIAPAARRLDPRNVDRLRVEWWHSAILPTNWKLAMEAFMEGYHVMRTHPQLPENGLPGTDRFAGALPEPPLWASMSIEKIVDQSIRWCEVLSEGMAGMVHANDTAIGRDLQAKFLRGELKLPKEPQAALGEWYRIWNDEITSRGRALGVPMPDLNDLAINHPAAPVQFIFPHFFLLPTFGNMSSYRIRPLTAETCLFEIWSLVLYPEGEERPRPVAPTPMRHDDERFPEIPKQDYSNLPLQQLGLHGGGFDEMILSREVEGLISNYQRVIDGFLTGVDWDRLVKGMQVATGELDDPIKDVGF